MRRLGRIAADTLLAVAIVVALLFIMAEVERREDAELRQMLKQPRASAQQTKWTELDEAGRRMTAYDRIGDR